VADSHPDPRCFQQAELLAELAPPGEVIAQSQAPKTPSHQVDESPEVVVVGEDLRFKTMGQAPEVVAVW